MSPEIHEHDTTLGTAKIPLTDTKVASLFFTHGPHAGQEVPLTAAQIFVGRSNTNDLILSDKSVSRKHAVINVVDGDYIISDLQSLKGTYVDGKKIDEVLLKLGDIINIGENRMQFRMLGSGSSWSASRKRGSFWTFFLVLILGAVLGLGGWFAIQKYHMDKSSSGFAAQVENHYNRGVELFNKEHDVAGAREEWKKVIEMGPEKKTGFAVKAEILLKSTEAEEK